MVSCRHVLEQLSNYIDNAVDNDLRTVIEEHLRGCKRCSVVFDTTRKTLTIYSEDGILEIPAGYSERLERSLLTELGNAEGRQT